MPNVTVPEWNPNGSFMTAYDVQRTPKEVLETDVARLDAQGPRAKGWPILFSRGEQFAVRLKERDKQIGRIFFRNFVNDVNSEVNTILGRSVAAQFPFVLAVLEDRLAQVAQLPEPYELEVDISWARRLQSFLKLYVQEHEVPPTARNVRILAMRFCEDQWREVIIPAMLQRYRFQHFVEEDYLRKHYYDYPPNERGRPGETDAERITLQRTGREQRDRDQWLSFIGVGTANRPYIDTTTQDGFEFAPPGWDVAPTN